MEYGRVTDKWWKAERDGNNRPQNKLPEYKNPVTSPDTMD
jgi:hypothetical protein